MWFVRLSNIKSNYKIFNYSYSAGWGNVIGQHNI